MAELKYVPVRHDHKAFLEKASKRCGFTEASEALEAEYALVRKMLSALTRAGLTQEAVATSMGTTRAQYRVLTLLAGMSPRSLRSGNTQRR